MVSKEEQDVEKNLDTDHDICFTGQNETVFAQENVETSDWPILILPFTLCGCWLLLVGLGFLCLGMGASINKF